MVAPSLDLSSFLMSLLNWVDQNWTPYSRWSLATAKSSGVITPLICWLYYTFVFTNGTIYLWCCQGILLVPGELPALSADPDRSQFVLLLGITPSQIQDFIFVKSYNSYHFFDVLMLDSFLFAFNFPIFLA